MKALVLLFRFKILPAAIQPNLSMLSPHNCSYNIIHMYNKRLLQCYPPHNCNTVQHPSIYYFFLSAFTCFFLAVILFSAAVTYALSAFTCFFHLCRYRYILSSLHGCRDLLCNHRQHLPSSTLLFEMLFRRLIAYTPSKFAHPIS